MNGCYVPAAAAWKEEPRDVEEQRNAALKMKRCKSSAGPSERNPPRVFHLVPAAAEGGNLAQRQGTDGMGEKLVRLVGSPRG